VNPFSRITFSSSHGYANAPKTGAGGPSCSSTLSRTAGLFEAQILPIIRAHGRGDTFKQPVKERYIPRGYKSPRVTPRHRQAIVFFRYRYKLSMNWISRIVGVSRRTVHQVVSFARRIQEGIGFDNRGKGFRFEVKIQNKASKVMGLKRLILRTKAFIAGYLDSPGSITEDEPP